MFTVCCVMQSLLFLDCECKGTAKNSHTKQSGNIAATNLQIGLFSSQRCDKALRAIMQQISAVASEADREACTDGEEVHHLVGNTGIGGAETFVDLGVILHEL